MAELQVVLNEAEQAIASKEQLTDILSNPENESAYPNIFKAAKEKGVINAGESSEAETEETKLLKHIQTRYGDGYASVEDFFNEHDEIVARGSADPLENLPDPIISAIRKAKAGEDWRTELTSDKLIDYAKNYTDKELLNIYLPGVYAQEDFDDETKQPLIQRSVNQVKQLHETAKLSDNNRKLLAQSKTKQRQDYFNETVEKAIVKAKKQNPNLKPEQIARLKSELQTGKFQSFFWDTKGGLNEDAALNLIPHVFGEDYLAQIRKALVDENNGKLMQEVREAEDKPIRQFNRKPAEEAKKNEVPNAFKNNKSPFAVPGLIKTPAAK